MVTGEKPRWTDDKEKMNGEGNKEEGDRDGEELHCITKRELLLRVGNCNECSRYLWLLAQESGFS